MAKFTCNFISYTLKRTVDITVVVPTVTIPESMGMGAPEGAVPACRHTPEGKFPVLYLLHGFGNNHATWTGYTNVELYAEERNIAVVMLSAENKFYVNHDGGDSFFDFIENELPDFVCGMFPVSKRPEDTYIAGLSMGGYGTLVHALTHPEKYAALGAFSAAVQLNTDMLDGMAKQGGIDPMEAAKKSVSEGKSLPKAYIACGRKDFLIEANEKFREDLKALGADVTWVEHPNYGHEWRFWDEQAEAFLDWIPRSDTFTGKGKRQI